MSDTTDSSPSFPTLSDVGDALSDITTADRESAIHPLTLSGIAKELLLVEAHYTTEEACVREQIEELKSTVRRQTESMASQEVVIERQAGEIKIQDGLIKCQGESIKMANGIIKRANSFIATLLAQRDTLQSKGEHQLHYPSRTTTADTPARLLPTLKTTLITPDIPVLSPMLKPYCEPKFAFGKPTPFFTFGDPIPVSPSKFARGLKPHHTHTRSKSAELRVSPAMSPFSSQKPLEEPEGWEPEGWKPEDWNKYLRFGPPTAENVF
ncbi:hypothetical protein V493_07250 [Pseudogymnoascus sp. VKM F-4281 (FW-2241)]|nr:hypothetical protein V493_07250 [Pseudogymnoascus sp. VKM F-4281 (FW-2241)]